METHDQRLVLALRTLNSELAASNRVVAGHLGINDSDLAVLDVLHREGPQTPSALARRTRMTATTMTNVLRRLARDGWVERRPNDDDLRSFTIEATSIDRLGEIFRPANQHFADLTSSQPGGQVEVLLTFLQDVTAIIKDQTDYLAHSHPASHPRDDQ